MRVKRGDICQTCRKQKISCDRKQPACTQCVYRGLACPGYSTEWTFVAQGAPQTDRPDCKRLRPVISKREHRRGLLLGTCPAQPQPTTTDRAVVSRPLNRPLGHLITYIIRAFVPEPEYRPLYDTDVPQPRVCGAWVEVLPELSGTNAALSSAISALAVTLLSGGPARKASPSSAVEAYIAALKCLRGELQSAVRSPSLPSEIAAAIMCLLLTELFLPTTLRSWTVHLEGFGQSMQAAGPEFFASGIPHKLFVGARPILTVLAFTVRRASFLDRDEWKHVPFSQGRPSPLQDLMSEGVRIPSILERLDKTATLPRRHAITVAADAQQQLLCVLDALEQWENEFHSRYRRSPLFGTRLIQHNEGEWPRLWFQSITDGNVATHYWAFKVICLANIEQVATTYPETGFDRESLGTRVSERSPFLEIKQLSTWIVQSIEYLMQEDMKLFGPSSILLPLRVAYDTFLAGGEYTERELHWCRSILRDTVASGYRFVPIFFNQF